MGSNLALNMTFNSLRFALFFMAAGAVAAGAGAKNQPEPECPTVQSMKAEQLYGRWEARFTPPPAGLPSRATVLLERHAEFSESLAGVVSRELSRAAGSNVISTHTAKAALAGDLEDGMLLLDESSDKVSITGTWNGEVVEGSCGKVFRGSWKDTSSSAPDNAPEVSFTLTKLP
jgi:hypothetical protein